MSEVRFKELCLDTTMPDDRTARFWADITGGAVEAGPDDPVGAVVGSEEGMGIAICPVPEPKTVKNRVHLDVSAGSLDEVLGRGATRLQDHEHWTVCADPEGNEFCTFVRDGDLPAYRVFEVVIDSVDAEASARWWSEIFGVEARNDGKPWWWLDGIPGVPTSGPFFGMVFNPVPEPKTVKNRLHWDVYGDPEDFLAQGATRLWDTARWVVLADPEGNEFCVFAG
jgi:catechol 2,3-dioxygenase-like lactoylglutathione lyase family enzyme